MNSLARCLSLLLVASFSAARLHASASAFVDGHGVLRWTDTQKEITQFGVNYTTPFAHAFRVHKTLGIPWEKAIDADVYHFARLGFDAYRVHVWDREISDPEGNLVVNEHVRAFDYLIAKLEARGIKSIITPLQFGDAGYPEGGEPLNGFSAKYGKRGCLEDKTSWPLQERYLAQFVSHINPVSGRAYKDDPDVIAFEICNEPGHFDYALTVEYINRMVKAIRDTGCEKPIFYNMSHGLPVYQAYLDANVQGGTFQWYPSNLVANHEQRGNFLPYVDDYPIPFRDAPGFQTKAKMIYEFDTADIGRTYLYPAMARTYRKAGMQFATQFAYDPMFMAEFNTEYRTHYLNLAYAPQKALSMKIASAAFHRVPLHQDYGEYPRNTSFAGVRVDYEDDLAELVTDTDFFYTNRTHTQPPHPAALEHVAGYAESSVVTYPGRGAYFLDRLDPGVWRLEVMPDAIWVRDPFERTSLKKSVARIAWNEWPMRIDLPDLGENFTATGMNDGNNVHASAVDRTLPVRPGTYLLVRAGVTSKWKPGDRWQNLTLKEFVAPAASLDRTYVLHTPPGEITAGGKLTFSATVASPTPVTKVELIAYLPKPAPSVEGDEPAGARRQPGRGNAPGRGVVDLGGAQIYTMKQTGGLEYSVEIPAEDVNPGALRYHIAVEGPDGYTTFPSRLKSFPTDWDFYGEGWVAQIVPAHAPVLLFDAAADTSMITADGRDLTYNVVASDRPGLRAMDMTAASLESGEHDQSFRFFFRDKINGRRSDLAACSRLVLYGKSGTSEPCEIQLALVTSDGIAYGGHVALRPEFGAYEIPVSALEKVRSPNIPHGYPVFIPFWSSLSANLPLRLDKAESVLVSIGPAIPVEDRARPHEILIERIWLQ